MVLWVYEKATHEPLGIVSSFSDLAIFWRYDTPSELRLELPVANDLLIRPEMLIRPSNGTDSIGKEAFRVTRTEIRENEEGDTMEVTALSCSSLLSIRGLHLKNFYQGTGGAIIKQMLDGVFADPRRWFDRFSYDIDTSLGDAISYETSEMVLLDGIENVCKASGLGFVCSFDPVARDMVFKLRHGVDHTNGTPGITPVVFDADYRNIIRIVYTESVEGMATAAYVMGETDSETEVRKWVEHDPNAVTGYDRYEVILESGKSSTTDQKDGQGNPIKLSHAQYMQLLRDYGGEQLAARTRTKKAEGELVTHNGLVRLGEDYQLGDIVLVRSKRWGTQVESRIREIAEEYSTGLRTVHLVVGDSAPTLLDKMKRL